MDAIWTQYYGYQMGGNEYIATESKAFKKVQFDAHELHLALVSSLMSKANAQYAVRKEE